MASLYRDPRSPFWYLKYRSTDGKWRARSLRPLRNNIPADTRQARAKRDSASLAEHTRGPLGDRWDAWVPDYIQSRYTGETRTRERVFNVWRNLSEYLRQKNLIYPQELTYRDCMDYMPWRTRKAAHNTARMELTILSVVCNEAVRRVIIPKNPATGLKIPSRQSRIKPELSDGDIDRIRVGLKSCPDWMSHAFEIALHQGCRLSETQLFYDDVELAQNRLHFRRTKGDKPFTVPAHPEIKPLLQSLLNRKIGIRIFDMPANASRDFHRFFKKLGITGLTFHCTRVTVVSRLARAGYPMALAMRLVGHSSSLVHRTYQRLQAQDVDGAFQFLQFGNTQSNENQDDPQAT